MSAARKLARRQGVENRVLANEVKPKKAVKAQQKAQLMFKRGQLVVSTLLRAFGHFVQAGRALDLYHQSIYASGTAMTPTGTMPVDYDMMYEHTRNMVRKAIKAQPKHLIYRDELSEAQEQAMLETGVAP